MQDKVAKSASPRLVRKRVNLAPELADRLARAAGAHARAEAEVLREAVELWLATHEIAAATDWKAGLMSVAGIWADHPGIDQFMADRRTRRGQRRDRINRRMRGEE